MKNLILKIMHDDFAENPRIDWDNLGKLFITENRYFSGDKNATDPSELDQEDTFIMLPVFHYTHSGTILNTTGFNCPWDSGQCGWIYLSRKAFLENWARDNVFTRQHARDCLAGEIETYSQYLSGDVWFFEVVEKVECSFGYVHENYIDSCGGFYGSDPKENGMSEHLEYEIEQYELA